MCVALPLLRVNGDVVKVEKLRSHIKWEKFEPPWEKSLPAHIWAEHTKTFKGNLLTHKNFWGDLLTLKNLALHKHSLIEWEHYHQSIFPMKMLCCLKWEFENGLGSSGATTSQPELSPSSEQTDQISFEEIWKEKDFSECGCRWFPSSWCLFSVQFEFERFRHFTFSLQWLLPAYPLTVLLWKRLKLQKGAVQAATSKSLQVLLNFSCALIIHQAPSITMYVEIHFRCRVTPYTLHLTIVFFTKRYILLTWRKITAKGSDLEKVSMSASLLKYSFFWLAYRHHIHPCSTNNIWSTTCKKGKFHKIQTIIKQYFGQLTTCRKEKVQCVLLAKRQGLDSASSQSETISSRSRF